ncbi:uncharacterized protein LOC113877689 [Bos indicus x Bos taurus]|uniref:uncharacterized protein LOC113877689 n=1 Tax=Bos indicus x Bos taurus TaxID=30522 RepID=UPI000F7D0F20|nr:uncharacterized protein LOC113877689 [Bos indicus x Bos taurus]
MPLGENPEPQPRQARGKRAAGSSPRKPVGGLRDVPNPRRVGAESWVFAGEMKVSVQLAYKVPVLGPQDRRLLLAPRRFLPGGRELGSQGGAGSRAGPHLAGPHRRRGGGARSPRALCGRFEGSLRLAGAVGTHSEVRVGPCGRLVSSGWSRILAAADLEGRERRRPAFSPAEPIRLRGPALLRFPEPPP